MNNKKYLGTLAASVMIAGIGFAGMAFADTPASAPYANHQGFRGAPGSIQGGMRMGQGVFGTVASVSGNTLTVNSPARKGFGTSTAAVAATTYTVDASSATVYKDNATSSVSSIASGDTVMIQGTVSGTNVVAKTIRDGKMPTMGNGASGFQKGSRSTSTESMISGDGNPVVAGTVSAISGNTVTLKNNSNTEFTIDVTNATVTKGNSTSSVSGIAIGDNILVQGTVNGNSVTASLVIDQSAKPVASSKAGGIKGFLGNIGGFFMHLFGF